MDLRPVLGGLIRPFGTAQFVIQFLKGKGPEDSKRIDPEKGAPMVDILAEYKSACYQIPSLRGYYSMATQSDVSRIGNSPPKSAIGRRY